MIAQQQQLQQQQLQGVVVALEDPHQQDVDVIFLKFIVLIKFFFILI